MVTAPWRHGGCRPGAQGGSGAHGTGDGTAGEAHGRTAFAHRRAAVVPLAGRAHPHLRQASREQDLPRASWCCWRRRVVVVPSSVLRPFHPWRSLPPIRARTAGGDSAEASPVTGSRPTRRTRSSNVGRALATAFFVEPARVSGCFLAMSLTLFRASDDTHRSTRCRPVSVTVAEDPRGRSLGGPGRGCRWR